MKLHTHLAAAAMAVLTVLPVATRGQATAFRDVHQVSAVVPEGESTLFMLDGTLYCYTNDVILAAQRRGDDILRFAPDTQLVKLNDALSHAVRHPVSGDLYFTAPDKKGFSELYCSHAEDGKNPKTKRVDMDGMSVLHPTFSADGRYMVFSSTGRSNSGRDYDLWYSRLGKEGWSAPRNMGNRVNTRLDETHPVVCGEYLYFSSNGHSSVDPQAALYVTPLVARRIEGDTVGMVQIGRGRVMRMPSPVNLAGSTTTAIAFDTARQCSYWLRRDGGVASLTPVHSLRGTMEARYLWGYVHRTSGEPMAGVGVTAYSGSDAVATTVSDSLGFYALYLPAAAGYTLRYHRTGFYADTVRMEAMATTGEYPIVEVQRDITLDGLPLRSLIYYHDLFEPNVSLALSGRGRAMLAPLVRFLRDNPDFHVRLLLTNDITGNAEFNGLLTEQRLQVLREYLTPLLPGTVKVDFWNGCQGGQSCASASGMSRLAVVLQP